MSISAAFAVLIIWAQGQTVNRFTCGFYSGNSNDPVTCSTKGFYEGDPTPGCYYNSHVSQNPNFGCCAGNTIACYAGLCLDYGDGGNTYTWMADNGGVAGTTFLCPPSNPYCTTVLLYGANLGDGMTQSFSSYGCWTSSTLKLAYQSPPVTTTTAATTTPRTTADDLTSITTPPPSPTAETPSFGVPVPYSESDSLTSGGKAGIGVGVAVGVIAVLTSLCTWLWCRRRAKSRPPTSAPERYINPSQTPLNHSNDTEMMSRKEAEQVQGSQARIVFSEMPANPAVYELGGDR